MSDVLHALGPVVDALDRLGVAYSIVGSVASSAHGVARSTIDIDLVATQRSHEVAPLVASLIDAYYVDLEAARDPVTRRSMFNAIHLATMLKVDVYIDGGRPRSAWKTCSNARAAKRRSSER